MDEWAAHNGCGDNTSEQLSEHVTDTTWQSCAGGAVEFYAIDGGGNDLARGRPHTRRRRRNDG